MHDMFITHLVKRLIEVGMNPCKKNLPNQRKTCRPAAFVYLILVVDNVHQAMESKPARVVMYKTAENWAK